MDTGPDTDAPQKGDYAKAASAFATDKPMQSAMREVHTQLTDKRFWLILGAVILILTVAGPFGTSDDLSTPELFAYWTITAFVTYLICLAMSVWGTEHLKARGIPQPTAQIIAAIPAGMLVCVSVIAINQMINFTNPPSVYPLVLQCVLVSVAINVVALTFSTTDTNADPAVPADQSNLITDKLAPEKRGALLHIETQDHYLAVTTTKGTDLILMRLTDAVTALGDTGVQTHRSHWVAKSAITGSQRHNNRWVLTLHNGATVPVSRPYVATLRDQGLIR